MGSGWQDPALGYWPGKLSLLLGKRLQLPVLFLLPPPYCSFQHTATLPIYYQTSPTPLTFGPMPPVDTPLTLGPIGALRVLALVCLLRNINADSKKINYESCDLDQNWLSNKINKITRHLISFISSLYFSIKCLVESEMDINKLWEKSTRSCNSILIILLSYYYLIRPIPST